MKCTRNSDLPTVLITSQIVYLTSVSTISLTFELFASHVTVTGRSYFAASLTDPIQKNLHYPIPNFVRTFTPLRVLLSSESRLRGFFDSIRFAVKIARKFASWL